MKKIFAFAFAALSIAGCGAKDTSSQSSSSSVGAGSLAISTAFDPYPPRKGANAITITLKDNTGSAVKGATVKISSTMPAMAMAGPSVRARDNGDGTYTAHLTLQFSTTWHFVVAAKTGGKSETAELTTDVK